MPTDFTEVYAVPGEHNIIDTIRPDDGLTSVYNHTHDEILERYPNAVRMPWEQWRQEQITRQQTPIIWNRIDRAHYHRMLEILPPIDWTHAGFLVGEPYDHDYATGQPRYTAFVCFGDRYSESSRPITRREWRDLQR